MVESTLRMKDIPAAEGAPIAIEKRQNEFSFVADAGPYSTIYDTSPVDRQVPWKVICAPRTFYLGGLNGMGLTLFGELYGINCYAPRLAALHRRIYRIRSKLANRPFQHLHANDASGEYFLSFSLVSKDGEAFLARSYSSEYNYPIAERKGEDEFLFQIDVPPGELAAKLWVLNGYYVPIDNSFQTRSPVFVLVTQSGKTFVRAPRVGSSTNDTFWFGTPISFYGDWVLLSGGVVDCKVTNNTARYVYAGNQPPPVLTVDPPPSGGTRASLIAGWQTTYPENLWQLKAIFIAEPGSGYDSPPQVHFSRQPIQGSEPTVVTELFDSSIKSPSQVYSDHTFILEDGSIRKIAVAPTDSRPFANFVLSGNSQEFSARPSQSIADETWYPEYPAGNSVAVFGWARDVTQKTCPGMSGVRDYVIDREGPVYAISSSGELFKSSGSSMALFDAGPWARIAHAFGTIAAIKDDGGLYTWGSTYGLFGDGSVEPRSSPVRVAPWAEWISCDSAGGGRPLFIAIRKDAVCRSADQPMEYWPDSYFAP